MSSLSQQQCEACRADAPMLTAQELVELRPEIPEWALNSVEGVARLERTFKFKNFEQALAFTNRIGELAEAHQHHPLISLTWGKVSIAWWTHKIEGLHRNDVIMAAKTDACFDDFSQS